VAIVKPELRFNMTSETLEAFILISSEKTVGLLDIIELTVIVDEFAATAMALPL
jgi:hypothetical protein